MVMKGGKKKIDITEDVKLQERKGKRLGIGGEEQEVISYGRNVKQSEMNM